MNVAFLGVGTMGSLMAANLADVGHRLAVYNRTTAKAEEFASDDEDTNVIALR